MDTSIWVTHLRQSETTLGSLLDEGSVFGHPFVLGELALGTLGKRSVILGLLSGLPQAQVAEDDEVMRLIDDESLAGAGSGYVDAHLLAAARLSGCRLWTGDRRLREVGERLGVV